MTPLIGNGLPPGVVGGNDGERFQPILSPARREAVKRLRGWKAPFPPGSSRVLKRRENSNGVRLKWVRACSTLATFGALRLRQEIRERAAKRPVGVHSQEKVARNGVLLPREICLA